MFPNDLAHIVTHYVNQKGDTVSHKKLQKLLYYVEAWNLVHLKEPIIDEDFQAWVHGPVIPSLYHELKPLGFNNFQVINYEDGDVDKLIANIIAKNKLSEDQQELIYEVLDKYGARTSFELEMMSHNEPPWIEARKGLPPHANCTNVISKDRMRDYYSSLNNG